ncbi:MAG: proline dehydrogenase family protein [Acidobacteria bacterium]|nr:proline dehydrogenase family protein [Acidobacteriota bacterium]
MVRGLLLQLSASRSLRAVAERSSLGRRLSGRFVAGTGVEDALRVAAVLNASGLEVSVDNLGENVSTPQEARQAAELYRQLLSEISERKLAANVSVKLTHMGFDIDPKLAHENVSRLVGLAASFTPPNFVRVDMEGSPYTERTLDLVEELHAQPEHRGCVGAVIQSYLRRSEHDVTRLLGRGIRIRLCKGAYNEPAEVAFQSKSEVDENYLRLTKTLLKSGIYHGLATHDEKIVHEVQAFAKRENIPKDRFEFQMLYGIRRDLQQSLVRDGWRMRVYVPFGTEWYPYLMRRLAERPANLFFVVRHLLRS